VTSGPASAPPGSPTPSPTPTTSAAPISAGAVADAGILYVRGADDRIYRYSGGTGSLEPVWRASTFERETADGAFAVGRHGGAMLLRWDGATSEVGCGTGVAVSVAMSGACASSGVGGVFVKLPSDAEPRQVLPADWGAGGVSWSPNAQRLLILRWLRGREVPGMDPGLAALWLMETDGRLREVYRPSGSGILTAPRWSPDAAHVVVWQIGTTSASFAADGVGIDTLLVDVASGSVRSLGTVMNHEWAGWSADGRLAFTDGAGRGTWRNKRLIVLATGGTEQVISPSRGEDRVALAPAWGPHGELGWVSGPTQDSLGGTEYTEGRGVGVRVGIVEIAGQRREIRCGTGRVVEGLRWSADGASLLLLCRVAGRDPLPLEIWLYRLADGTSAPLVRGLQSGVPGAGGFGYYGMQPPITSVAAWSRGLRP
jgi:hypothetical protein